MSAVLVNDHEKRIETEILQLLIDIRRIHPEDQSHCSFGDLFTDPQVEQYYEALVGTLKSAKKRGLVHFKGQILLKGMHDDVVVSVVGSDDNGNGSGDKSENVGGGVIVGGSDVGVGGTNGRTGAQDKLSNESVDDKTDNTSASTSMSTSTGVNQHIRKWQPQKWKPKNKVSGSGSIYSNNHSHTFRSSYGHAHASNLKLSNGILNENGVEPVAESANDATATATIDDTPIVQTPMQKKSIDAVTQTTNSCTKQAVITPTYLKSKTSSKSKNIATEATTSTSPSNPDATTATDAPAPLSKLQAKLARKPKRYSYSRNAYNGYGYSHHMSTNTNMRTPTHSDNIRDDASFATAPTPHTSTLLSSPSPQPQSSKPRVDTISSNMAGLTFQPNSIEETHQERVAREVKQLLLDIRRIKPQEEKFCAFGDLFVDEDVQQYYEALIGTLKAAKRKGLISFQGQMLFKGMHDNVQITIVE